MRGSGICVIAAIMVDPEAHQYDLERGLKRLGYTHFRSGQREAIEVLLRGGKLLLVAPTGGGKSLCYQLPSLLLPGTALVVSPLIALMQDQVASLSARGVAATFLASTLEGAQVRRRMARLGQGAFELCYVAPERLAYPGFRSLLRDLQCGLVAIDEAHCISEWGHDFRPEYLKLGEVLADLQGARVLACTATATPVVRDEILSRLGLAADTPQIVHGFARPNLALRALDVASARQRRDAVDGMLREVLSAPKKNRGTAIVYAPTRRATDEEAQRLKQKGWAVVHYHAGLENAARDQAQRAFIDGHAEVVVATCAFGMGIDRPDVRAVVHLAPPGSLEAYYQEVGRAGRDGALAFGMMLVSPGDMALRRHLIERTGSDVRHEVVEYKWGLFLELMRWADGGTCRHDAILRYFGDEGETLSGCGKCDVCIALDKGDGVLDEAVVTLYVRKALSAVARVHGRFGLTAAVRLLRGTDDPRLQRARLDASRTFGILKDHPERWLLRLLRRCVTAGWADFTGGDRPVIVLTHAGADVMRGRRPVKMLLASPHAEAAQGRTVGPDRIEGRPARARSRSVASNSAEGAELFDSLRKLRMALAKEQGVPPYVVASDRTLRDIALLRPRNIEELKLAHGIGATKAERYGKRFLRVVAGGLAPGS